VLLIIHTSLSADEGEYEKDRHADRLAIRKLQPPITLMRIRMHCVYSDTSMTSGRTEVAHTRLRKNALRGCIEL
jgi:hypothetical protein